MMTMNIDSISSKFTEVVKNMVSLGIVDGVKKALNPLAAKYRAAKREIRARDKDSFYYFDDVARKTGFIGNKEVKKAKFVAKKLGRIGLRWRKGIWYPINMPEDWYKPTEFYNKKTGKLVYISYHFTYKGFINMAKEVKEYNDEHPEEVYED